jgi:acetyltransferase-like isoleucine patch superfamily enzyme
MSEELINYNATFLSEEQLLALPFAARGENVLIDSSAILIGVENIHIGSHVRIDAHTLIISTGPIKIGSRVHISAHCYLEGRGGIRIDDFSNIASYVSLHSVSDDPSGASLTNPMVPDEHKTLEISEIILERHSLVFTKSTLLPGTVISEGAVIGAHSLVRGVVPPWTIYGGTPARYIKQRTRELLELERALIDGDQA